MNTTHPIRFGIQTVQQHGSWQELLSLWRELDTLGFDSAWVFDHFIPIFSDPTGPCLEGWTALSALAMATQKMRVGVMVTGNTYRHPAVLAKMATTVDIISNGRLILGMGAGWFEREHNAYGITFPRVGERLARLNEAIPIIKMLWTEERVNFNGRYYQITDAPFQPKPVQKPHPPILVGATGEKVALKIVARHAEIWNTFGTPDECRHKLAVLTEHCHRVGRDPASIEKSVLITTPPNSPDVRRQIEDYLAVGITHIIFSVGQPYDRPALQHFAQEVMPAFR
ncbi:MAG: LLM class F420-dependent oxidoreductase [Candidatus Binatia bacterium]